MAGKVLTIGAAADELHQRRLGAVAAASERLGLLTAATAGDGLPAVDVLRTLAAKGRIAVSAGDDGTGPWTLDYVPSPTALAAVATGSAPSWGARVDAKQQKVLRRTPGAVFRLPFADPATGVASGGTVSTFTTDWSPFTAACAVVIHPDHEALAGTEVRQRPYFSGRFVRHPLHGDLLPVWVADWAKPEFGTGAVIVNPAHSAADLEFARTIGFPIRFGLGAHEPGADPESWLTPPVIKTGVAVRAGRHDGLSHQETVDAYLNDLLRAGHADRAESVSLGRTTLATLNPDPAGPVRWTPTLRARSLVESAGDTGVSVSIEAAPLLTAATAYPADAATLVSSADAVAADLLFLRLLLLDTGVSQPPVAVLPVARVGAAQGVQPEWLDGALLVAGRTEETISVKAQLGEQIERIAKDHAAVTAAPAEPADPPAKAAAQIVSALAAADFPATFAALGTSAKALRRGGTVDAAERAAMLAALYVLFGLPLPADFSAQELGDALTR